MIPKHIVIIPDGNRRWAKINEINKVLSYNLSGGYNQIKNLCTTAKELGVKYFSLWAFSTENWKRTPKEIKEILDAVNKGLDSFIEDAHVNKYRFRHLGKKDRLPSEIKDKLNELEKRTSEYQNFNVILGLDYGGRDELIRAVNRILKNGMTEINEEIFKSYLDTKSTPDPDLIIRTGGEKRLSGFMPFQSAYSELYFTDILFPDFKQEDLKEAILEYNKRERRFGG